MEFIKKGGYIMAKYRVIRNGNNKFFVATDSLKFARTIAKEEIKRGLAEKMEIKEQRGGRYYKIETFEK